MEGQGAQAQRVDSSSKINKPICNYTIIFRDDSDGKYYGKLCDGTVEPIAGSGAGALLFTKFTIKYSDFQPNAGTPGDFKFGTVPAGSVIVAAKMKPSVRWASSSDTSASISLQGNDFSGQPTSVPIVNDADNLMDALDDTKGSFNLQFSAFKILNHNSPSDLWARIGVSGGASSINDLTAGELEVWLLLMIAK